MYVCVIKKYMYVCMYVKEQKDLRKGVRMNKKQKMGRGRKKEKSFFFFSVFFSLFDEYTPKGNVLYKMFLFFVFLSRK